MTHWIEFLGEECIHALGWTFVHTLWQGSLLAVIMIFALSRIPDQNAQLRYRWAFGCLIGMLIMAVVTFMLLYDVSSEPVAGTLVLSGTLPAAESSSGLVQWFNQNLNLLVAIWIVGMIILLGRLGLGLLVIERIRKTAQEVSQDIEALTGRIAGQLNYHNRVRIAQTSLVNMPVVMGVIKPIILFPIGAINQLSTEEVEAVLAHELAHLVRNDFLQNIVQSLIETIFYYHPAIWWISAVVRSERENCCDDLAVKACGSHLTYARALVHLQDMGQSRPALALPFLGSKHHLLKRIKRILNQPQNKSNIMEKITATGLLLLCLIFASFNGTAEHEDATEHPVLHTEFSFSYAFTDTVPPAPDKQRIVIHRKSNDREVQLIYWEGEIKQFSIDGEVIPKSDYGSHEALIAEMVEEAENLPPPPPPPAAPRPPHPPKASDVEAPALPPAPPLPSDPGNVEAPKPPLPPTPNVDIPLPPMPPTPPAPTVKKRSETLILRETDDHGNTIYRIETEGDRESTIYIDDATSIAHIDGQEIIIDADTIIVIEEVESRAPRGIWSDYAELPGGAWIAPGNGAQYFFDQARNKDVAPYIFELQGPDSLAFKSYNQAFEQYQNVFEKKEINKFFEQSGQSFFPKVLEGMDCDSNWQGRLNFPDFKDPQDKALFYLQQAEEVRDWAGPNEQLFYRDTNEVWELLNQEGEAGMIARLLDERDLTGELADAKELDAVRFHVAPGSDKIDAYVLSHPEVQADVSRALNAYTLATYRGGQDHIVEAMAEEGLIDPDDSYSIVLSENKLKINGKKMPDGTLEKYKQLYERTLGYSISGKTKIEISNE